jgi:hypothetical protein
MVLLEVFERLCKDQGFTSELNESDIVVLLYRVHTLDTDCMS